MTNKEVLAELKQCYEYLNDIDNNGNMAHCNGQLNAEQMKHIHKAMNELAEVYSDFRATLDDEETQVIINDEIHHIGNSISEDYSEEYDEENGYTYWLTCGDLDYYWYEDEKFLDDYDFLYDENGKIKQD